MIRSVPDEARYEVAWKLRRVLSMMGLKVCHIAEASRLIAKAKSQVGSKSNGAVAEMPQLQKHNFV